MSERDEQCAAETPLVDLLRNVPVSDGWRTYSEKPDDPMAGSHLHGDLLERAADHIEALNQELALMDGVIHLECLNDHYYSTHIDHSALGCPVCLFEKIQRMDESSRLREEKMTEQSRELEALREDKARLEDGRERFAALLSRAYLAARRAGWEESESLDVVLAEVIHEIDDRPEIQAHIKKVLESWPEGNG